MKYFYLIFTSSFLVSLHGNTVLAQELNDAGKSKKSVFLLEGKIKDEATGEPLPFANISIRGTKSGTSSNVDGHFTLIDVPSDTCTLIISNIGYQTYYLRLTPQTKRNNLVVQLSSSSNQLDEIVVTGESEGAFQSGQKISMVKMTPAN